MQVQIFRRKPQHKLELNCINKIVTCLSPNPMYSLGVIQWQHKGNYANVCPSIWRDEPIMLKGTDSVIVIRGCGQDSAYQQNAAANLGIIHAGNNRHVSVEAADDGRCLCIGAYYINVHCTVP